MSHVRDEYAKSSCTQEIPPAERDSRDRLGVHKFGLGWCKLSLPSSMDENQNSDFLAEHCKPSGCFEDTLSLSRSRCLNQDVAIIHMVPKRYLGFGPFTRLLSITTTSLASRRDGSVFLQYNYFRIIGHLALTLIVFSQWLRPYFRIDVRIYADAYTDAYFMLGCHGEYG